MAEYISAPVETDPDELKLEVFDHLRTQIPGWEPRDGQLDVWMIEAFSEIAAQLGETATFVVRAIFRWYGSNLVGVTPIDAIPATGVSTWTAVDSAGYTIPVGTTIALPVGESLVAFQTTAPGTIPASSTSVTGVPIVALEAGAHTSLLSGTAQLVDPLTFISSVTVPVLTPTAGGSDAETEDEYFDRLASELRLLTPRAIRASDFEVLAQRVPEVDRALALDNYVPMIGTTPAQTGVDGAVTVVVVNSAGEPLSAGGRTKVAELLAGEDRLLNLLVYIADPTYTTVNVTFAVVVWPDRDPAAVRNQAVAAVQAYLSPANWGQPPGVRSRSWVNETVVRRFELAQVLNEVDGVHFVNTLTINGGTADVTLTGVAPLPRAGTITGTAT
jgi:hypothetical protein